MDMPRPGVAPRSVKGIENPKVDLQSKSQLAYVPQCQSYSNVSITAVDVLTPFLYHNM